MVKYIFIKLFTFVLLILFCYNSFLLHFILWLFPNGILKRFKHPSPFHRHFHYHRCHRNNKRRRTLRRKKRNIFHVLLKAFLEIHFIYLYSRKHISEDMSWVPKSFFGKFHFGEFIPEQILYISKIMFPKFKTICKYLRNMLSRSDYFESFWGAQRTLRGAESKSYVFNSYGPTKSRQIYPTQPGHLAVRNPSRA